MKLHKILSIFGQVLDNPYNQNPRVSLKNKWISHFKFGYRVIIPFEDEENLEATKKLYSIIRKLIDDGHQVDCIDVWTDTKPTEIKTMDVEIDNISDKQFRLFVNYLFRIHA